MGSVVDDASKERNESVTGKPTVVFVLGGPGSGKGTQCANIVQHFGYTHLSAGDLLRAEIISGSENGTMIQNMIKEGKIVPSGVTIKLLQKAMQESGNDKFLIDGFPRNEENRVAFEAATKISPEFVLFFDCPEEEMERRLLNRNQGRDDDNIETIRKRFKVFLESSLPVVEYYNSRGKVRKINAGKPVEEVFEAVKAIFTPKYIRDKRPWVRNSHASYLSFLPTSMGNQKPQSTISKLFWFFGIVACIKLLLIPSYHSTDFEVHRNWLALTRSLPLSRWYFDETSPWTLDYPPFFAYFEYILSFFAQLIDPQIVDMNKGLNYKSNTVIYFQRISVIVSDLCLLFGVYRLTKRLESGKRILIWVLVVWSPGLVIVDHMHFQYNGFLIGLLILSISYLQEGRDLMGGFLFAVLLCLKHLFAVAAPVYFVYLLKHYCWQGLVRGFGRLSVIGAVVMAVFAAAFGPFLYHGQVLQVISRMFPFGRGLCHAYWAPNFWVFYIILDKGLAFLLRKLGFNILAPAASFTGGLVGHSSPFTVLPEITPLTTFIMVVLALFPCIIKAWRNPQPGLVARWISYACTCGFLFGWHVHEKASLHFVIPLAIVAVHSLEDARHYFLLSIACCYSLFPLLYETQEYPIKVLLLLLHSVIMWQLFSAQFTMDAAASKATASTKKRDEQLISGGGVEKRRFRIGWVGKCYLLGLLAVETWGQFLHPWLLGDKLPFVPLLLVSIGCALEIMYSWIWQLRWIMIST